MNRSINPIFSMAVRAIMAIMILTGAGLFGNDARAQGTEVIEGKTLAKIFDRILAPEDVGYEGCTLKQDYLDDIFKGSATVHWNCEVGTEKDDVQDYSITISINTRRPKGFYCSDQNVESRRKLDLGPVSCGLTIEDTSKSVLSFISSFRHEYRVETFGRYTGSVPGKPVKAGITVVIVNKTDGESPYYHPSQNRGWAYELAQRVQKQAAQTFAGFAPDTPQTAQQNTGSTNVRPTQNRPPRPQTDRPQQTQNRPAGPRIANLNGIDLARIIKRVVPPSRITFNGCRIVEDPPSQRPSTGMSSYGTKFECRDGTQRQGVSDYDVFVNLKLNHKAIAFCRKPPPPRQGGGSGFTRFLQPSVNASQKFYTNIGDKACGTTKRLLRQQSGRGSHHAYHFEIYDRLSETKTIGVRVGVSSWMRGKPLNPAFDRKLARGIAEDLYAALYRKATGGSVAARNNRPPANNQPPPPAQNTPRFAELVIDNTTSAELAFRHYFEHPQGRLRTFTYKEGGRKVTVRKRVKEIRYPNSVVAANKKRTFGRSLRKGFNHIEYQPKILATYYINNKRVRDDTGVAFFDTHARGIKNGKGLLKPKAFRLNVRDTGKVVTATIEPRHIEPAKPKGVLPGSLYIENNLDVPVRVYFDENQDRALKGQGTVGGLARLMMLDSRTPDFDDKRVRIPARSTAFFLHMLAWPGQNNLLVRAKRQVSPRAGRKQFEHTFYMDNKGGRNLERRFKLIITERQFTR